MKKTDLIEVVGKIGNTDFQNNDRCKVLSRKKNIKNDICRCLSWKCTYGCEDMEKKIIMLGVMDSQGYELDNRVYSAGGLTHTESRKRKDNSSEEV